MSIWQCALISRWLNSIIQTSIVEGNNLNKPQMQLYRTLYNEQTTWMMEVAGEKGDASFDTRGSPIVEGNNFKNTEVVCDIYVYKG